MQRIYLPSKKIDSVDLNKQFFLERDTIRIPYTKEVAEYCEPFSCDDKDLDEFFLPKMLYIMILNFWVKLMPGLI